jgi:hexokinase
MSQRQAVPLEEILHCTPAQLEAIRELEGLFCLDRSVLNKIVEAFRNELVAGLADDRSSDLNMIPTYVTG